MAYRQLSISVFSKGQTFSATFSAADKFSSTIQKQKRKPTTVPTQFVAAPKESITSPISDLKKYFYIGTTPPKTVNELSPEQVVCLLQSQGLRMPLGVGDQVIYGDYMEGDSLNSGNFKSKGLFAWIKSPYCPPGKFSIARVNYTGEIEQETDCRDADPRELLQVGIGGSMTHMPTKGGKKSFALQGPGYFLLNCDNGGTYITKIGQFYREGGVFRSSKYKGCTVMARHKDSFLFFGPMVAPENEPIDEFGCYKNIPICFATPESDLALNNDLKMEDHLARFEFDPNVPFTGYKVLEDYYEDRSRFSEDGIMDWNIANKIPDSLDCSKELKNILPHWPFEK